MKLTKQDIIDYFTELSYHEIPDNIEPVSPECCKSFCPFIESCRKNGAANLCDIIIHPEDF